MREGEERGIAGRKEGRQGGREGQRRARDGREGGREGGWQGGMNEQTESREGQSSVREAVSLYTPPPPDRPPLRRLLC